MLATMAAIALLVYQVVGVGFLRRGWVNVDRVWAGRARDRRHGHARHLTGAR